jgi:PadR family transcriptional regulator PadR
VLPATRSQTGVNARDCGIEEEGPNRDADPREQECGAHTKRVLRGGSPDFLDSGQSQHAPNPTELSRCWQQVLVSDAPGSYGIVQRLGVLTQGRFQVTPGSLFPALQRIEDNGWAKGSWGTSENNRRARFYTITRAGGKQLVEEQRRWDEITVAVSRVLEGGVICYVYPI